MVRRIVGRLEAWQRTVEDYTVGFVIAMVMLERAKRRSEAPPRS